MRKITLFLMLFCMFVGTAWAQWPNHVLKSVSATSATELTDGYYVIYNNGRGTFLNTESKGGQAKVTWPKVNDETTGVAALNSAEALTNEGAKNKNAYVFYVNVEEGGKVSLKTGYGDFAPVLTGNTTFNYQESEAFWNYEVKVDNGNGFVFLKSDNNVGLDCNGWSASDHTYSDAAGWNADGSQNVNGNQSWTFYSVDFEEVTASGEPIASVAELKNNMVYVFKSGRSSAETSHYLLYHTDAPDNLSSTYGSGHAMEYSDETENFQFAVYNYEGQYYFYNIAADKFIGNANDNNAAIPLVSLPTNGVQIRTSNNATYNFVLSTNGTGALNAAATAGCHGVVNWTGGYNDLTDGGNCYQIIEVGVLPVAEQEAIGAKIRSGLVVSTAQNIVNSPLNANIVGAWTTSAKNAIAVALDRYNNESTEENLQLLKAEVEATLADPTAKVQLLPGEKFTVKCVDTNRGYMVYSTVEGKGSETQAYLAGSNRAEFHAAVDAEGIYKEWAITSYEGKNYIYNVQKKQFINSDGVVKFTDTPFAVRFIDIENGLWEIQFENNNKYLSFSPGWGADCVRTEGGIDNGCKFYLEKVGESVAADVTSIVETSFVNSWKTKLLSTLGYVGGAPISQKDVINAVTTLAECTAYDQTAEKVALGPGYYFIKGTGNGNNASWYITYGENGTDFQALPVAEGQKLGAKHVWSFDPIEGEDGYKLKSCNLGKYAQTVAAPATSQIISDINNGYKFTFTNQGECKFIIKDGNNNVLRTENGGELNYWGGENNETWYLIPATELEVDITAAGWATTHLPFDVQLPENLKAYAVSAVAMNGTEGSATLVEKTSIPANEGAILEGAQGTYTLKIAQAEAWTGNKLEGSNVNTYIEGSAYVLGIPEGETEAMFAKAVLNKGADGNDGTTHFLNNANKAYLPMINNASAQTLRFNFGETTGIEGVIENTNANAVIFDLSGRRVAKMQKGIYIVNGKKVYVK